MPEFYFVNRKTRDGSVVKQYASNCVPCRRKFENKAHRQRLKRDPKLYRMKLLISGAKHRAKKEGLAFGLSMEWLLQQNLDSCPILKQPFYWKPSMERDKPGHASPLAPSIDRIDSSKGYTPDNCWVISQRMNTIKNNSTYRELFVLANAVAKELMNRICNDLENGSQ